MSFLTPFFLLGGLAIAAPIIYHLIRRTTRDRTKFSSLMFLLPSPPRISKRHRVEHILLLLLRCLALALLALGFARPFFKETQITDPTAAQPKRILVLVDTSASMRRAGLWDEARARVETVLNRAGPADQVALYAFERQATPLVPFEDWNRAAPTDRVPLALGRLGAVTPGWGGTHLGNALITAAEALAENETKGTPGTNPLVHEGPRQVVLISDLQAGSRLDTLQAYEWPKGVDLVVEPLKARNPTNAGLQLVAEAADSSRAADDVRVRVTNSSDARREQFQVGWVRPAAAGGTPGFVGEPVEAYVPPGQSRIIAVPLAKGTTGVEQIALRGDDEDFDNAVHAIPPIQHRASVLWLGAEEANDSNQPLFFLRQIFFDTPRLAVQVVAHPPAGPVPPEALRAANLIFVSGPVPANLAAALREQAQAGKLVVFLPKAADAESSATLGALLGGAPVPLQELKPSNYAMVGEVDFRHPLFAAFADPRYSDFTKVQIWRYRKIEPGAIPGARAIAKFDSGDPALLEVPAGQGRVFVMATGWSREDSQMALWSKFPQLMWLWLELGGGVAQGPAQYFVGDKVPLPPGHGAATLRAPGGTTGSIAAEAAEIATTAQPGIYELAMAGGRTLRFAVNVDASESRTVALGPDELEDFGLPLAQDKAAAPVPQESKSLLQGSEAENRQKLWRWFIAATLAVLLFESALAGWTARRSTPTVPEAAS